MLWAEAGISPRDVEWAAEEYPDALHALVEYLADKAEKAKQEELSRELRSKLNQW